MQNTTTLEQPKVGIVKHYYKQYMNNYRGLNMEFTEFMASKLSCSEAEAVQVIRQWKKTTITLTNKK
tara:strand:- start:2657 stop:2857 length:201 start_codon:yes stop_codon:yes gene_type:complete